MHNSPAGASSSSSACAIGTHDGRVDRGDSPEAQATFSSPSMSSQVTQEQPEIGALGPQTNDSVEQWGWADALRKALEGAQLDLGDVLIDQIVPGCPASAPCVAT